MLCGSGKGEVMRVIQRWVDHDKVQSFKVKRREGHQIVNVHEYWFKEGVERRGMLCEFYEGGSKTVGFYGF